MKVFVGLIALWNNFIVGTYPIDNGSISLMVKVLELQVPVIANLGY